MKKDVLKLAREQFNTFRNRLYEMLSEIEEEYISAFIQGYAKGEADEQFRCNQLFTNYVRGTHTEVNND